LNIRQLHVQTLVAMHDMQLAEHGGIPGVRSRAELEYVSRAAYAYERNVEVNAALYAITIIRRRPFIDANKRVAFLALTTYLELYTRRLNAYPADCVDRINALAQHPRDDLAFIRWVSDYAYCMLEGRDVP
jgi:death-on-curing protein